MSKIQVYRASAGSGKTYTLTKEYLKLLFKNPGDYRQILAVTFTNKATTEMRSRILSTLYDIASHSGKRHEYMSDLEEASSLPENEVRRLALKLLRQLLHDYANFSVSTIDSFFQKVTRSFAREMGLPVGFRLEMETERILQMAVDQLILEMDSPQHKELKSWLIQFARERMEEDKGWNISNEILTISKEIFSEKYQANALALAKHINNKEFLNTYKKALEEIVNNLDSQIQTIGKKALEIIKQHNLDINNDFKGKSRTKVKCFEKMANLSGHLEVEKYIVLLSGSEEWTKNEKQENRNLDVLAAYNGGLLELVTQAVEIISKNVRDYHTAKLILPNLNALGMLNDVNNKLMELCREENIFLISGTNHLLTRIIENNETPFIYEKTGTRYIHYMIDEFQDTSSLQYANFLPLIRDSLASEKTSLLVGDVKQAIYRWRNSDWNLLAEHVERDFDSYGMNAITLDTNWRSDEEIIKFNNAFFSSAAESIQQQFNSMIPDDLAQGEIFQHLSEKITKAYSDIKQNTSKSAVNSGGRLHFELIEGEKKEDFQQAAIEQSIKHIHTLCEEFKLSEISVLVRNNNEAVLITDALLSGHFHPESKPLPVISNESLVIANSELIRLIIAHLELIQNPENLQTESFILQYLYKNSYLKPEQIEFDTTEAFHQFSLGKLWQSHKEKITDIQKKPLYELTEAIIQLLPEELVKQHSVYVEAFQSLLLSHINQESADLNRFLQFWYNKGCKHSLSIPENQEAIRVMTIHKSKGLEFKAVVVPFASWELNTLRHGNLLWFKPNKEPFNAIPLVPVKGVKLLGDSWFAADYLQEVLNQYVDNLNITYVAFTRARRSLSVFAHLNQTDYKSISTIGQLIHSQIATGLYNQVFENGETENDRLFSLNRANNSERNQSVKKETKIREEETLNLSGFIHISPGNRLKIHLESENYFTEDGENLQVNYGKVMHSLFELISTTNDVEKAFKTLRFKGIITEAESENLKKQVEKWLLHPKVKHWFDGTYQVKNEAAILSGTIKRPDRVMIKDDEVIVVDYKFGQGKHPSHQKQVQDYILLVKEMGYSKVKGYIWYPHLNEINETDQQGRLF
ncbi:UvrD-helicase domain-containing protein [Alkalitalea saponilacus]|uniref:DNA 3'-5' helicase n=1 Tax=Alkalitalea saponilacus TaxID=889453 RepID=A0A1T5DA64_9BACT|nr:UvrD-helicase domain-containing protein [Alkalitalea saponilacus]ASB50637.1 ATP-dependent helicase [Alkalitalea saponilacus]SKB68539.1 ATP-dependent exoDNAse (exonuclease V) beta subunit (contains helicase and exonuclease domains) [Alkalitalea saponilacus]